MKTKSGEEISWSEYMKRWKEGIANITPAQRLKAQISGIKIQLIGIIGGLAVSIYNFKQMWWIALILFGALIMIYLQYNGLQAQAKVFKDLDENAETQSISSLLDALPDEEEGGEK